MPRTAKRYLPQEVKPQQVSTYRAGIYVRLSNERHESWRAKSSSPQTQEELCRAYALQEAIDVVEVYLDYEYSGTNFNRPAYQQMMQAVRERKINCILIKDLSRLGREHLEMGRLIDKVFPFLGVRFISVNDHLDTAKGVDSNKSFEVMLKNIINDMYAKDISAKILSTKHQRAKDGYFIGSVPPYGYRVEKTKLGQKLVPDENTAPVLRHIYQMAREGKSQLEIARTLNREGVTSPMVYFRTRRMKAEAGDAEWNVGGLGKILTNPAYTGKLVQGVRQQNLSKGQKQHKMAPEDYIVTEHAHEAILSQELFDAVQRKRRQKYVTSAFKLPSKGFVMDRENRYDGLIFDGRTGLKMLRRNRYSGTRNVRLYYTFLSHIPDGKTHEFPLIHFNEDKLDTLVMQNLTALVKRFGSKKQVLKLLKEQMEQEQVKLEDSRARLEGQIQTSTLIGQKLYERYATGELDKEQYLARKQAEAAKIAGYSESLRLLEAQLDGLLPQFQKARRFMDVLFHASSKKRPDRELLQALISRIDVQDEETITITFAFNLPEEVAHA